MQNDSVLVSSKLQLNPPQAIMPARKTIGSPATGNARTTLVRVSDTDDSCFIP